MADNNERLVWIPEKCVRCKACQAACPAGAIEFDENGNLIWHKEKCLFCKACEKVCPAEAIKFEKEEENKD
jgi:pyruvate formate lyase activating enzyme